MATAVAMTLGLAGVSSAQDSRSSAWRGQSLVGSTRVALSALYEPSLPGVLPRTSMLVANAAVAPVVSEHWQVGVSPSWSRFAADKTFYQGALSLTLDYLPGSGDNVSRPFVGVFVSETGATEAPGFGVLGAQTGWIHFLSPSIALRAEARLRHVLGAADNTSADLFLTFDPYVLGRAQQPVVRLPGFGVFDATVVADLEVKPTQIGQLNSTVAPFLTRWFQVGGTENFTFLFSDNEGSHYLELYGRAYLPVSLRLVPFVDVYTAVDQGEGGAPADRSHGERAGMRAYLAPGVALDLAWQWRDRPAVPSSPLYSVQFPEERTLRIGLTTQFRATRER